MNTSKPIIALLVSVVVVLLLAVLFLIGMQTKIICFHEWTAASCDFPQTCQKCSKTQGIPLGHDWFEPDCENPVMCSRCGETHGQALGHKWSEADCTKSAVCTVCGKEDGAPLGHVWLEADCENPRTCSVCGETSGKPGEHKWDAASCTAPAVCSVCGKSKGEALGHKWIDATVDNPQKCSVCGITNGSKLDYYPAGTGYVKTNDSKSTLTLRKSMSTSSDALASIPFNTALDLWYCDSGQWYYTKYNGQYGYVSSAYISFYSSTYAPSGYKYIGIATTKGVSSSLIIRESTSTDSDKIGEIPKDSTFEIWNCGSSSWFYVYYNGKYGYVSSSYVSY